MILLIKKIFFLVILIICKCDDRIDQFVMLFTPELGGKKIFLLEMKKRLTDFYVISSLIYGQSTRN